MHIRPVKKNMAFPPPPSALRLPPSPLLSPLTVICLVSIWFLIVVRYDLTFQFDSIPLKHERDGSQKDLLLYLPDKMLVVDQVKLAIYFVYDLKRQNDVHSRCNTAVVMYYLHDSVCCVRMYRTPPKPRVHTYVHAIDHNHLKMMCVVFRTSSVAD